MRAPVNKSVASAASVSLLEAIGGNVAKELEEIGKCLDTQVSFGNGVANAKLVSDVDSSGRIESSMDNEDVFFVRESGMCDYYAYQVLDLETCKLSPVYQYTI